MQALFGKAGLYIEIAGIVLAILSFSGMTERIEKFLCRIRDDFRRNAPLMRQGLSAFLPTWSNFRRYGREALWQMFVCVTLIAIAAQTEPKAKANLEALYGLFLPWTDWKIIDVIILAVPVAYMTWAAMNFILGIGVYLLMSAVWRFFWLLSRPPSGVMGSIGLVFALSGPIMKLLGTN
ncbi:hypothetical protein [Hyphococcus sp.]|uniref:hypothetical protein n=1 Tax=Hyphococcus sp. TaxID=2038636 RepID=UPI003D10B600